MDIKLFAAPPAKYRPLPFWAWNDRLEPDRVREQVRHMSRIGFGGFFMHSRQGLVTPYLQDEWMEAVEAALSEAEKLGMDAWLYDEDRYPSGPAGGLTLEPNPFEFAAKHLVHIEAERPVNLPGTPVACFAYSNKDGKLKVRELSVHEETGLFEGERFLGFYWDRQKPSTWFNGYTYIDTLDPNAVRSFIEHGLEPYKKHFGKEFGGRIPGVFTDEPQMFSERTGPDTSTWPWTVRFPIEFRRRRGYDLLGHLASLVLTTENYRQVRYDFWRTAIELFLEAWCEQIARWCSENNLKWTGHYWEHEFPYFHKTGSFMAPLAYFDVPGIDLLGSRKNVGRLSGNEIQPQMGNVQMVKLASSVAHQTGKQQVLSETYGGAMSDISFVDQKIMADWEMALGVNVINPHLYHYSIRGLRKRDYPPSWGSHQPWSHEYKPLADYLSRVSYALTEGEYVANIAVLHPTTVFWVDGFEQQQLARAFEDLCKDLTENNWDYDLADEFMLESLGRVDGNTLCIGKAAYDVLILPEGVILAPHTVKLIAEFVRAKGRVVVLGKPQTVRPEDQPILDSVLGRTELVTSGLELQERLRALADKVVSVRLRPTAGDYAEAKRPRIYTQVRKTDHGYLVFLANVGEEDCASALVTVTHTGSVVALNPYDGRVYPVVYARENGGIQCELRFLQGESYLLLVGQEVESLCERSLPPINVQRPLPSNSVLLGDWEVRPLDVNPLVLDYCSYRIGGGDFSPAMPIWDAYCRIRSYYGLATSLSNRDVQPWRRLQERRAITSDELIEVKLSFVVTNLALCRTPVKLAIESGEQYEVRVNGKSVKATADYWLDPAFTLYDVTGCLIEGENTVILATTFSEDLELENSFLLGGFSVTAKSVGEPNIADFAGKKLHLGDWTGQGYPFYAGKMEYSSVIHYQASDGIVELEIGNLYAQAVTVYVNDNEAGKILFPPYRLDITPWMQPGENAIRLVATNSLRNLTDPLHHVRVEFIAGPETFSDRNNWQDEYNLARQGIDKVRLLKW